MFAIETLDIEQLEQLRDEVNRRILAMRRTTGLSLPDLLRLLDEVKATLTDQGKEWHSLERWQYIDGEMRFWLNPKDHDLYQTGWFSIDDLIAWARETGPVVHEEASDDDREAAASDAFAWVQSDTSAANDAQHLRLQRFEPYVAE